MPLFCPDSEPFKLGWGLYFIEEFSQFYLGLVLVPVLLLGLGGAAVYCKVWGKSLADGATVVSGVVAVVMYVFGVAQGWGREKGGL